MGMDYGLTFAIHFFENLYKADVHRVPKNTFFYFTVVSTNVNGFS